MARVGQYSGFDKSGKNREILDLAVECFPVGLPRHSECWPRPEDVGIERFSALLTKLLIRSPPEFLTNRRYSADIASWFYLMQWGLSAFEHFIPGNSRIAWWPGMGESIGQSVEEKEEAELEAKRRTQSTIEFPRSNECGHSLVLAAVTSIPRWNFARSLESKSTGEDDSLGLTKATRCTYEPTENIIDRNDPLIEALIGGESIDGVLRLKCCKALLASVVYIFRHRRHYGSAAWKLLKGEISWEQALEDLRVAPGCCDEDGFRKKIRKFLTSVPSDRIASSGLSVKRAFEVGSGVSRKPGGFTTKEAEERFSLGRMSGLKNPYRSTQPFTCYREVFLRWLCREHRSYVDNSVVPFFGGKEEFDSLVGNKKCIVNSFGVFTRRMGKMAPDVSGMWADVRRSTKNDILDEALSPNAVSIEEYTSRVKKLLQFDHEGPFGSHD